MSNIDTLKEWPKDGSPTSYRIPELSLKDTAQELLDIIFDKDANEEEIRGAATTLVELVAPDILEESIPQDLKNIFSRLF